MKFAFALASIFLSTSTLVSAGIVASTSVLARASCEGGEVTGSSTVDFNGNAIGLVSATCSQSGSKKRSMIEARQYDLCSEGDCYPTCEATSTTDILLDDCALVIEYLAEYASTTAVIPAGSSQRWYAGTCAIYFYNLDAYDYTVCYDEVGYDAAGLIELCTGVSNGAVCDGSMEPGDAYEISIQSA